MCFSSQRAIAARTFGDLTRSRPDRTLVRWPSAPLYPGRTAVGHRLLGNVGASLGITCWPAPLLARWWPAPLLARTGGDEFVLIAREVATEEGASGWPSG